MSVADLKLDELKVDPSLWMRLATPQGNSGSLKSVFPGTKNPFTEDGANAAYARIQQLAPEGKLYASDSPFTRFLPENSKITFPSFESETKASCFSAVPSVRGWNQ